MNLKYLWLPACLLGAHPAFPAWFPDTPLQNTLETLMQNQPQLAWQELRIALSRNPIDSQHWKPVKQAILSQTQCGKSLTGQIVPSAASLTLSFISHTSIAGTGYQIKLSSDQTPQAQKLALISPQNQPILQGEMEQSPGYQELEEGDLLTRPPEGLYQLLINDVSHPVIVSGMLSENQLTQRHYPRKTDIRLPATTPGCEPVTLALQWFDKNYNMLGQKSLTLPRPENTADNEDTHQKSENLQGQIAPGTRISLTPAALQAQFKPLPAETRHISITMAATEYQQGLKIRYIRRVALPDAFSE